MLRVWILRASPLLAQSAVPGNTKRHVSDRPAMYPLDESIELEACGSAKQTLLRDTKGWS
jgi:hypothetical protein